MTRNSPSFRSGNSGNVLFLILIAVALFGALSYVVTQSSRVGGGSIEKERAKLDAAEILNHVTAARAGIKRLLINGCEPRQINLGYASYKIQSAGINGNLPKNPLAPLNHKCDLFHPAGGGVTPLRIDQKWDSGFYADGSKGGADSINIANRVWWNVWVSKNVGPADGKTTTFIGMSIEGISRPICVALNEGLGIPASFPPEYWWNAPDWSMAYPSDGNGEGGLCYAGDAGSGWYAGWTEFDVDFLANRL